MIISKTPFRVSLFGGGSDFPEWYRNHGGSVIGTTIDKYCYISVRILPPFFEHKHRIVYGETELVQKIADIKHPSVQACLERFGEAEGFEVHYDGDLPARSGLGSSSSFTVGLINALNALKGARISKEDLALSAINIEQNVLKEAVGSQDQVWAAYGGFNRIDFGTKAGQEFNVRPVYTSGDRLNLLNQHLLLFFTGQNRTANEIEKDKISHINENTLSYEKLRDMVGHAQEILDNDRCDLTEIGLMMNESWHIKKGLSKHVSNTLMDTYYSAGLSAGALGGKLLGAGGGGFMLFFAPPDCHSVIKKRLKSLIHVDFKFETEGSHIIVYEPLK
jgi:D-glycero-alpha-D-manno-heptose-7-phosphate kinase